MSIESSIVQLREIPQTVVRFGIITGLIIAGYIVIDQGARPVYANGPASPTSTVGFSPTLEKYTPTAVRTSTVRALLTPSLTPTRGGRATETVPPTGTITTTPTRTSLQEVRKTLVAEQTRTAEETEISKIQAEINRLRGTPTEPPTPTRTSTSTATPTSLPGDAIAMKRDDFNKLLEQAVKIACDAKVLPTPTSTATPRVISTTSIPGSGGRSEGGFPWEPVLIGGGIATVVFRRRVIGLLGHIPARIPNI